MNKERQLEEIEQAGREAFLRGDNLNPYIEAPNKLMTKAELMEWSDKFEAWGIGYIDESRKQ